MALVLGGSLQGRAWVWPYLPGTLASSHRLGLLGLTEHPWNTCPKEGHQRAPSQARHSPGADNSVIPPSLDRGADRQTTLLPRTEDLWGRAPVSQAQN